MNNKSSDLRNWEEIEGKLCKDFKFNNFIESFGLLQNLHLNLKKWIIILTS